MRTTSFKTPAVDLPVHLRQLEGVAMKMEGMSIVGLVIERKAVTRAFPQSVGLVLGIKALAVNGPVIELL